MNPTVSTSDPKESTNFTICINDTDEDTSDELEITARKSPELMVTLETCDTRHSHTDQASPDNQGQKADFTNSRERSSGGPQIVDFQSSIYRKERDPVEIIDITKENYESQKSNNAEVSKSLTSSNKQIDSQNVADARKYMCTKQKKKRMKPSRHFNLRSLDVIHNLRRKPRVSTRNDMTVKPHGNSLEKIKKTSNAKIKNRTPPESPPLNPTLPFVELDFDDVVDESQFLFEPIQVAENPQSLPQRKKKRGRKPKYAKISTQASSEAMPRSEVFEQGIDQGGKTMCLKISTESNLAITSGSEVFEQKKRRGRKPQYVKISTEANSESMPRSEISIQTTQCDPQHRCCQKMMTDTSDVATQWEDPTHWFETLEVPTDKSLLSDAACEQTAPSVTAVSLSRTQIGPSHVDQSYCDFSQLHVGTNLYQNTSEDIHHNTSPPVEHVTSGSGLLLGMQGHLLPASADEISVYQPPVHSSHLCEPAGSTDLVQANSVDQTQQHDRYSNHLLQSSCQSGSSINNSSKSANTDWDGLKIQAASTRDPHKVVSSQNSDIKHDSEGKQDSDRKHNSERKQDSHRKRGSRKKRRKLQRASTANDGYQKSATDDFVVIVVDDAASDSASDQDVVCIG